MPKLRHFTPLLLALALGTFGQDTFGQDTFAQDTAERDPLAGHPGFVDFGDLGLFGEDDLEIHVSVKGPLLRLVAATTRRDEPELASMLESLEGIELRVYNAAEPERGAVRDLIGELASRLTRQDWQSALTVRSGRSYGYVFLRLDGETPQGLAAMLLDDDNQVVFVNIVGEVDPSELGRLAGRFGVEALSEENLGQGDAAGEEKTGRN